MLQYNSQCFVNYLESYSKDFRVQQAQSWGIIGQNVRIRVQHLKKFFWHNLQPQLRSVKHNLSDMKEPLFTKFEMCRVVMGDNTVIEVYQQVCVHSSQQVLFSVAGSIMIVVFRKHDKHPSLSFFVTILSSQRDIHLFCCNSTVQTKSFP